MSHNTWTHRLVRLAVRPLATSPLRPNHVTFLRTAAGLGAASILATGRGDALAYGAGLALLSLLLDRADGELARLSGRTSHLGHVLDLWSDAICNAALFIGLGWGLSASRFGALAPWMGLAAGLAVAAIFFMVLRLEAKGGARAGELGSQAGFDPDDGMFAVPVLIWLGWSDWLLLAAAIGAPLFSLYVLWRFTRDRVHRA